MSSEKKPKKKPRRLDPFKEPLSDEEYFKLTGISRTNMRYLAEDLGVPYDATEDVPLPPKVSRRRFKVLGRAIGAADEIIDGDGDGKYTAVPGAGDTTPVPLQLFDADQFIELRDKPDWDLEDIVDLQAAEMGDPDTPYPDEQFYEFHDETIEEWGYWDPCREIRQAAYLLAGQKQLSNVDPHVQRTNTNPWAGGVARSKARRMEQARYLLGALAQNARFPDRRPLYRAVRLTGDERERFWESVKEGQDIAIPLIATSNNHELAGEEILGGMFGRDVLLEILPGNVGVTAGSFTPFYNSDDEQNTLNRMEETIEYWSTDFVDELNQRIEAETDEDEREVLREELEEILERIKDAKETLKKYTETRTKLDELLKGKEERRQQYVKLMEDRDKLRAALARFFAEYIEDGDEIIRWHGDVIEESDGDRYYDETEASPEDTSMHEVITGGRFSVESIDDDPRGIFGKIVRLRQLAVFDPQKPGSMIQVADAPKPTGKVKVLWL